MGRYTRLRAQDRPRRATPSPCPAVKVSWLGYAAFGHVLGLPVRPVAAYVTIAPTNVYTFAGAHMVAIELSDDQADRLVRLLQAAGDAELLAAVVAARQRAQGLVRCQQCGTWFAAAGRARFCSATCKQAAYRQRVRDWRRRG
jgi:hypothetical protein